MQQQNHNNLCRVCKFRRESINLSQRKSRDAPLVLKFLKQRQRVCWTDWTDTFFRRAKACRMALKACTLSHSINQRRRIIEKNSSFAKFCLLPIIFSAADKCNVALYFINKGAVDELYEIIYGRCFLYGAHEWKSLSLLRGT
jgi:hypothetical protein